MTRPRALAFDIFGTVVDWRRGIAREAAPFLERHLPGADPAAFADAWRRLYQPAMEACRNGGRPYVRLDTLHLEMLEQLLRDRGLEPAAIDAGERLHLAHAWRRLDAWPDARAGIAALRERCPAVTLSNANVALMVEMNRRTGIVWDAILGAEVTGHYKPAPQAYLRAAEILGVAPGELCLVAAHHSDLAAARACGLQTAFVARPMEYGGAPAPDTGMRQAWDWEADDLVALTDAIA